MEAYDLAQEPYFTSSNSDVAAFTGHSKKQDNRSVTVLRHELAKTTYKDWLSEAIGVVLNCGLEQARADDQKACRRLRTKLDLKDAPEKYTVFYVVDTGESEDWRALGEREIRKYLEEVSLKLQEIAKRAARLENAPALLLPCPIETDCMHVNKDIGVSVFRGVHQKTPIIIKRHKPILTYGKPQMLAAIEDAINVGILQARMENPNICRILEMRLDTREAPDKYRLDHLLEALDSDLEKEIRKREMEKRHFSELEIWNFVKMTASALAHLHSKVKTR